jgi:potassium-transporting ATPase KdpC subunit
MRTIIIALKAFIFFTVLAGIIYPLLITGIAQLFSPEKANGSIIMKNGKAIGSKLIGQQFDTAIYFSSRPSAITYNPLPSGGSNYSLANVKLKQLVDQRKDQFILINHLDSPTTIPSEMLFASASGLDPHISLKAALLQVERIAKARNFNTIQKQKLLICIKNFTEAPQFLCLGEERINVLLLNLSIDRIN